MSKGDAEHAGKAPQGIQARPEPPVPQTIEQRVTKLEEAARLRALEDRVTILEAQFEAGNKPEASAVSGEEVKA